MIVERKVVEKVHARYLKVSCEPRGWSVTVNGESYNDDNPGVDIPCRFYDLWTPLIDIDTGQIINWRSGTTMSVYLKVCDAGAYTLLPEDCKTVLGKVSEQYVPGFLSPKDNGYGDYIIMDINEEGYIDGWEVSSQELTDFFFGDE